MSAFVPQVERTLENAHAFAEKVYSLTPLKFGMFVNRSLLEKVIKTMIARGYMEGVNATRRQP